MTNIKMQNGISQQITDIKRSQDPTTNIFLLINFKLEKEKIPHKTSY